MSERRKVIVHGKSVPVSRPAPPPDPIPVVAPDPALPPPVIQERPNSFAARVNSFLVRPYRNPVLHWAAFVVSMVALAPPSYWLANSQSPLPGGWVLFDILLSVFFVIEFFTRSGFRWNPASYIRTRFFDFIAIVPLLVLVYFNVPWKEGWVWIILAFRVIRSIDRVLGDDFFPRNIFALAEGFEEELTDRVTLRIINRLQADLARGRFGEGLARALEDNREPVLARIQAQHPREGVLVGLAHIAGLDAALEKAEERVFDSIVEVLKSPEVDGAIRESFDSAFISMRQQIGVKTWKEHLGIRLHR
jgi:hypothetical protein